jgi:hypothetical protein
MYVCTYTCRPKPLHPVHASAPPPNLEGPNRNFATFGSSRRVHPFTTTGRRRPAPTAPCHAIKLDVEYSHPHPPPTVPPAAPNVISRTTTHLFHSSTHVRLHRAPHSLQLPYKRSRYNPALDTITTPHPLSSRIPRSLHTSNGNGIGEVCRMRRCSVDTDSHSVRPV